MDQIDREELELSLRFYRGLVQHPGITWTDLMAAITQIKVIESELEQEDALVNIGHDSRLEVEAEGGR